MKRTSRITALLLAALMLLGTLAACSDTPASGDDTTAAETTAAVTTEPEETNIPSGLPETMNLEGYTITFYGKDTDGVYAEEETGDLINDEVYRRNDRMQAQYNFSIKEVLPTNQSTPSADILATVQAGEDAYQVIVDGPNRFVTYINNGLLLNLDTLKYQDLSQPWWSSQLSDGLSLDNKYMMACNAFMLSSRLWLYHPIVNIDLLEANGMKMADYYKMASDGTWTLDEFIKIIKNATSDLNGDGVLDHNDRWDHEAEEYAGYALALGCGYQIADKDDADMPFITAGSESSINLWDRLVNEIFADKNTYLCVRNITGVKSIWTEQTNMMRTNRILVQIANLTGDWREFEINYGVLPMPKLTPEQKTYRHTGSSYNLGVMAVPVTVKAPDTVSFIVEALAYDSYYNLLPLFYRKNLETKLVRDKESVEMLRIIHDTMFMDPGAAYNWGGYLSQTYNMVKFGRSDMATYDAANREKGAKAITDIIAKVREVK